MSDHVVAIVQARLGSSRLPRKALQDIGGTAMWRHVLERASGITGVHTAVAAIPEGDDELGAVIKAAGFPVITGSAEDVLERYADAARVMSADIIVRITADCPLLDPQIAAQGLQHMLNKPYGFYWAATVDDGGLDGLDVEVFRRWILEAAHREATEPSDREHVTPWIRRNVLRTKPIGKSQWPFKVSVDTVEDLLAVRAVYKHLRPGATGMMDTLVAAARAGIWIGA